MAADDSNLNVVESFPYEIEEHPHVTIPLSDGTELAARIWRPKEADPVPAILEYIPYRKRDFTVYRDLRTHPYLAGHGYACVRVDLRGAGDSEGVLRDEYLEQELEDGLEVLRWIAAQPWCTGDVGMMGISWGGFNGLQIAALTPPELKAVVTLSSTDDRYADDVHYMGGCLLGDNLSWASVMFAYNSLPPDPDLVGSKWRTMWIDRLKHSGLWLDTWLRHQRRDDYWKHGSVCEDFRRITCPVMAVSGWADGYTNSVFRLLRHLDVPCKALVGPWSHLYPHMGKPGPAIGFLQETLRWWNHWLKGIDNGVTEWPALRAWMQDSVPPTTSYDRRPGRWVAEPEWPSPRVQPRRHYLAPGRLLAEGRLPAKRRNRTIQSPLSVGLFAGKWCSYSATPDLPHDQRQEDGGAMVFDSGPLEEDLEILGAPVVELELSANRPVAMIAVRLSDIAEDDKATRITYGLLNLCHRDSHEAPEALEPGKRYRVRVQMNDVAQRFPAGHSLRVAISTSYWPLAWAPPEPVRLTIYFGDSFLELPVRPKRPEDEDLRPFDPPEAAPPARKTLIRPTEHNWFVTRDLARDKSTLTVVKDDGAYRLDDIDLEITSRTTEWYSYLGDAFDSVRGEVQAVRALKRGDWQIETRTRTVLTSDEANFRIRADLDAYENDSRVYSKSWDRTIPRDLV